MPPIKPATRPHCYICGTVEGKLTKDHLPPEGFFPPEKKNDLIVAPACPECHNSAISMDDEAMRFWLSSAKDASKSGKWVQRNKALPKLLEKPQMTTQVAKLIKTTFEFRDGAFHDAEEVGMPASRAIPFIRRITKGLLYTFYPDYDYFSDSLRVQFEPKFRRWENVLRLLTADSRGDDVFQFWHGLASDSRKSGIWIYRFYEHACFVCMHSHLRPWRQPKPPGYKEFHKLPKNL